MRDRVNGNRVDDVVVGHHWSVEGVPKVVIVAYDRVVPMTFPDRAVRA